MVGGDVTTPGNGAQRRRLLEGRARQVQGHPGESWCCLKVVSKVNGMVTSY